jgi:hypothetical protein
VGITELFEKHEEKRLASVGACDEAAKNRRDKLLLESTSTKTETIVKALPLPLTWIPYFLLPRSPRATYGFMKLKTKGWTKLGEEGKEAFHTVMNFARACLTEDTTADATTVASLTRLDTVTAVAPTGELADWLGRKLLSVVQPIVPTETAKTPRPHKKTHKDSSPDSVATLDPVLENLVKIQEQQAEMLREQHELAKVEPTRREEADERAKERDRKKQDKSVDAIPEKILCNLLGFAGLSWSERHELNPIFAELKAATTKSELVAILKAFFNELAHQEASFHGFVNSKLFADITEFQFMPGLEANTAHTGASLLAFVLMDTNEMRQDEEEDKVYDNATMLTTADTRKRNTSKAVQPPTTLPDLLQLLNRYRVFAMRCGRRTATGRTT